ncbi:MAG: hypothetical protein CM1200mP29_02970 [Verrucomicrobiota bacterium]|nr:MAG: hypothetical protein CM1200mP29_02970 [Verrucomicrobiota bacterium]
MFANLQLTWIVPMLFAAVFWVGCIGGARRPARRGSRSRFVSVLFVLPIAVPKLALAWPTARRTRARATSSRAPSPAPPSAGCLARQGECRGKSVTETKRRGGVALFWTGGVKPKGEEALKEIDRRKVPGGEEVV